LAENLSMSYTLYNLFQLYISTHDIIHAYNPTAKFIAIKAILGIAVLQSMIIKVVVKKFTSKTTYFSDEFLSEYWSNFALCVESVFLALAHNQAYPISELEETVKPFAAHAESAKLRALELFAAAPQHGHGGHGGSHGGEEDAGGATAHDEEAPPSARGASIELVERDGVPEWTPGPDTDANAWPEPADGSAALREGRPARATAADAPRVARIPAFDEGVR
jgi:hypothetical protein